MTTTEARIILPVANNEHASLDVLADWLRRLLCERYGGFTETAATGGWLAPSDRVAVTEPVRVFDVACEDIPGTADGLRDIASHLAHAARQEAIYLRLPNGSVEFITRTWPTDGNTGDPE